MGAIIDFFTSVINFLVGIVESIVWFVTNLPSFLGLLTNLISSCPSFLQVFLSLSISAIALFAVLKLI